MRAVFSFVHSYTDCLFTMACSNSLRKIACFPASVLVILAVSKLVLAAVLSTPECENWMVGDLNLTLYPAQSKLLFQQFNNTDMYVSIQFKSLTEMSSNGQRVRTVELPSNYQISSEAFRETNLTGTRVTVEGKLESNTSLTLCMLLCNQSGTFQLQLEGAATGTGRRSPKEQQQETGGELEEKQGAGEEDFSVPSSSIVTSMNVSNWPFSSSSNWLVVEFDVQSSASPLDVGVSYYPPHTFHYQQQQVTESNFRSLRLTSYPRDLLLWMPNCIFLNTPAAQCSNTTTASTASTACTANFTVLSMSYDILHLTSPVAAAIQVSCLLSA